MLKNCLCFLLLVVILLACKNNNIPVESDDNSVSNWDFDSSAENYEDAYLFSFNSTKNVCLVIYTNMLSPLLSINTPTLFNIADTNDILFIQIDCFDKESEKVFYTGGYIPQAGEAMPKIVATWKAISGKATIIKADTIPPNIDPFFGYIFDITVESLIVKDFVSNKIVSVPDFNYREHISGAHLSH